MTKAQLRTAIKLEARIKSSTNLDTMVDNIVEDILTDLCNKARYHELLQENEALTLVDAQGAYALPADYQNLEIVRYGIGPDATVFSQLLLKTDVVQQRSSRGRPRFYKFVAGPKISVFPYDDLLATDSLLIDYYVTPMSLYTTEGSAFPVPRLESAVKKSAIARVQRFSAATTESQMSERDGDSSFVAGQGAS